MVIEAEHRSGTSITAQYAKKQSRILCCIPGNIENRCSIGTNRLIQQGAILVVKPSEIIEILEKNKVTQRKINSKEKSQIKNQKTNQKNNIKNKNGKIKSSKKEIPKQYEDIYNIIKEKQIHINDICKISKKSMQEIGAILTMLELEGLIEQLPGNILKIKD